MTSLFTISEKDPSQETPLICTPLSGNEQYCLSLHGLQPGEFVLGNHIFSLGIVRGISSLFVSMAGGTNTIDASFMSMNRLESFRRMEKEAQSLNLDGVVGIQANVIRHSNGALEFLITGGGVKWNPQTTKKFGYFTAACSGEQLACLLDLGFVPLKLVYGTESWSRGLGGAISGAFKVAFVSGEVEEYSQTFMAARNKALERLRDEAFSVGANFISAVKLTSTNFGMLQEVSFMGTACRHPNLPTPNSADEVITSGLSEQELWSLCSNGFFPKSLVLAVSIYNMGLGQDIGTFFQNLGGGELTSFSELVSSARHRVQQLIVSQAKAVNADKVLSLQTDVENFAGSGCVEFFAYGTAVSACKLVTPQSPQLAPQHFNMERTVFSTSDHLRQNNEQYSTGHRGPN